MSQPDCSKKKASQGRRSQIQRRREGQTGDNMAGAARLQLPVMALGLLLMAVHGSDGLRCYSCSATTGHPCQHDPAGLGPSSVKQCDASSDSCVTEYSYSTSNRSVTKFGRHCGHSLSCIGCLPLPNTDKAVCTTCCKTDLCNTDIGVTSGTPGRARRHILLLLASSSLTTILVFVNYS
ncbi:Hypp2104 [Branchiostoma lanceolatum]|uniref:Hypp2104 protein n=2 Tax=Branchiostoma lanceolatum TaxID=7740 RepID=A0A8K0ENX8_BRALA|nr:Hypp2104 [Branchiostoma lanceolatum]